MNKKSKTIIIAAASVILASMCGIYAFKINPVEAKANGISIRKIQLNKELRAYAFNNTIDAENLKDKDYSYLKEKYLSEFIDRELIVNEYKKSNNKDNVKETAKESLDRLKGNNDNKNKYLKSIKESKVSEKVLLEDIEKNLEKEEYYKSIKVDVADKEIEDYYSLNKMEFMKSPGKVHLYIIASKTKSDADAVYDKLIRKGDFLTIAKQFSVDSRIKTNGGDLGSGDFSSFPKFITDKLISMNQNEVSKPYEYQGLYYIIKPVELEKPEIWSLKDIKEDIKNRVSSQKKYEEFKKKLAELKK